MPLLHARPFPFIVFHVIWGRHQKDKKGMYQPGQTPPTQLFSHYLNQLWHPWPDLARCQRATGAKVCSVIHVPSFLPAACFFSLRWIRWGGKWEWRWRFLPKPKGRVAEYHKGIRMVSRSLSVNTQRSMKTRHCGRTCQRKKRQRDISIGASQTALKYTTKSMSFWVSAETRFTISPTVKVLLAELFITKDWIDDKRDKDTYPLNKIKNKYPLLLIPKGKLVLCI